MGVDDSFGPEGVEHTIYWACDDHVVPLKLCRIGGAGDTWHVYGGGYSILKIQPGSDGHYHYYGNDYGSDDIQVIVDYICEITGEGFKRAVIDPEEYPVHIIRYPPYFEPMFRSKAEKVKYYRQKLKGAEKELEWKNEAHSERELQVVWRR